MRHHRRQHPGEEGRIFGLLIGLVGVNHELEPANSVRDRDRGIGACRVGADFTVGMAERIVGDVDDQPAGRRGGAVERHPHQPASGAPATVAADHVAGQHSLRPTLAVKFDGDRVGRLGVRRQGPAPLHVDVLEALQSTKQFGVDQRLDEPVALGPAETRVGRSHFGKYPALGVDKSQNLVGHGVRQNVVDQADRLERAQRLVVQPDAAGIVDQRVAFFDHQSADALQAKDIGQGQTNRSRADNDNVDIHILVTVHRQRPSRNSTCRRLNVLASSYCGQWPQPDITSKRAPGIIEAIRRPSVTSAVGSSLVHNTSVGAVIDP